jgi:2-polyprenyl-3-methyl-5-hydroxy-6-metoxy-1,4-benzoquinol methylase
MAETSPDIWEKIFEEEDPSLIVKTWKQDPRWLIYKRLLDPIRKEIFGKDAVELGCGTGQKSLGLVVEYNMRVTLVDFSDVALKFSRILFESMEVKDVEYLKMNILDFDRDGYKLSHSQGVIEHNSSQNRRRAIRKHVEPLEIGGYSLISMPNKLNILYSFSRFIAEKLGKWEYGYENPVTIKTLSKEMMDSRLRLITSGGCELISPAYGLLSLNRQIQSAVKRKLKPYKGDIGKVENYIQRLMPFLGGEVALLGKKL